MNAIVTVVGQDRVGIIAAICNQLAGFNVNILDISQTILQGSFTMVMAVDIGAATASFGDLSTALAALGAESGSFRGPGTEKPFAMYRSLNGGTAPDYFGLGFD